MKNLKIEKAPGEYFPAPMWSHSYFLKSEKAKNGDKTWYQWKVEIDAQLEKLPLIKEAKSFAEDMSAAKDKLQPETEEDKASKDNPPF